jgi:chloramphenicol O-acetyltransferase
LGFFNKKRKDGVCVSHKEAFVVILPYVMKTRTESLVYYEFDIEMTNARKYMQQQRKNGENISFFNLVVAAAVQTFAKYKRANRFIAGRRIYQRNNIEICYAMKREMTEEGEEVTIKLKFDPEDDVKQVAEKMNGYMHDRREGQEGSEEKLIKLLTKLPRFVISGFVGLIKLLDFNGLCPTALVEELPFWSSLFITNMGSLGMRAPLHHLYEIGTCSMFLSMGRLEKTVVLDSSGKPKNRLSISFSITVDERIVDGFYLSRVIDNFQSLLNNPERIDLSAAENKE